MSRDDEKTDPQVPNLHLLKAKPDMTPLNEIQPKSRFGRLLRRSRNVMKMSLRETAEAILSPPDEGEKDRRHVFLGELERGKRPPSEDIANAAYDLFGGSRDEFIQAARDWHEDVWSSEAVVLQGAEFSIASLAPTHNQTRELKDELRRVLVDLENLTETVDEVGEGIAARVDDIMSRMRATLADSEGPKEMPLGEFPDIELGNTNGLNVCKRCGGSGVDPEVDMVDGIRPWELRCQDCEGTGQWIGAFELGRVYVDMTGRLMHIIGMVTTAGYGATLVAERSDMADFRPVAMNDHGATLGWREVFEAVWWRHWLSANPESEELKNKLRMAEDAELARKIRL